MDTIEDLEYGKFVESEMNTKSTVRVTLYDSGNHPAEVDNSTHTLQTIEYEHHEIHAGSHYMLCGYDSDMSVNELKDFVIITPNTTSWAHMTFDFSSSLGATLNIYEGVTGVSGGTSQAPINNNRNTASTSSLSIILNPTAITPGTAIIGSYLSGGNRTSGFNSRDKEIVLKQGTSYLFRFQSLANSNTLGYCGEWYEHTNK
jgi:hypothetical protein